MEPTKKTSNPATVAADRYDSAFRLLSLIEQRLRATKPARATWSTVADAERIMNELWEIAARFYIDSADGEEESARAMAMQAAFGEIVGGVSVAPEQWIAVDVGEANAYGTFPSADVAQDWCEAQGEDVDEYFVTRLLPASSPRLCGCGENAVDCKCKGWYARSAQKPASGDASTFRMLTPSEIAAAAGPRTFCPSLGATVTIPERECPGGCGRYESECKCPQ